MSRLVLLRHQLVLQRSCQQPLLLLHKGLHSLSTPPSSSHQTVSASHQQHRESSCLLRPLLSENVPQTEQSKSVMAQISRQLHTAVRSHQVKSTSSKQMMLEQIRPLGASTLSQGSSHIVNTKRHMSDTTKKHGASFFSLRSLISTPFPFMVYGLGGLIPFVSAPLYMFHFDLYDPFIASAQLVYGACILSFLGGVAWGNDLHKPRPSFKSLGYSIGLPLVGWCSVLLDPNPLSFVVLMSGVATAGYADTQFGDYPDWFRTMRFLLSSVVLICLFSTFSFYLLKDTKKKSVD